MSRCHKCNIKVNTIGNKCPLCNSEIEKKEEAIYPAIKKSIKYSIIKRVVLFIILLSCITVAAVNYVFTPTIKWSLFIIIQLLIIYHIINKLLKGSNRILSTIFACSIFIYIISLFWDYYTGFNGWSINYVFPSLSISYSIFIFIFRMIKQLTFHTNSNYIYVNLLLGFVPIILLYFGKIPHSILTIISGILALINLLVIVIFDWHNFKSDIEKNLYI